MRLKPVEEQVVVVLGASSGIGRAAALRFARCGAKVVAAARGQPGLESLIREIGDAGGRGAFITADASDPVQVRSVAEFAWERFGGLDTWVQTAAVTVYAGFEDTTIEEFEQVIRVNLLGQIYGAKAALPYLRKQGRGALIHVSSAEARRALPLQSAYAASKHGMHGFLDSLRMELQHEQAEISVTEIMPASVNTPLFDKARTRLGVKPRGVPPVYDPWTVADAIVHAAQAPARQIVVGSAGKALLAGERISPRLLDRVLDPLAFQLQKSVTAKSPSDPNNLFESLPGHDRVEGTIQSTADRVITGLDTSRPARWALAGLAGLLLLRAAAKPRP